MGKAEGGGGVGDTKRIYDHIHTVCPFRPDVSGLDKHNFEKNKSHTGIETNLSENFRIM